jgi:hypothetical protein
MKQKMNFITLLVFLYAGIVCAVVKPETRSGVVKQLPNDAKQETPLHGLAGNSNPSIIMPSKTLFVFGIR